MKFRSKTTPATECETCRPADARGNCHVRVFLESEQGQRFALGAADITIAAPNRESVPAKVSLEDESPAHIMLSDQSQAEPAGVRR